MSVVYRASVDQPCPNQVPWSCSRVFSWLLHDRWHLAVFGVKFRTTLWSGLEISWGDSEKESVHD